MSDSQRTATEQLLISSAVDQSINQMNFSMLAGKDVYFDHQYLEKVTDEQYIISSLRQQLLANGVILREKREDATYVVEARAGAVGTNRHDVLVGVPATTLPNLGFPGMPSSIPEIPLAKVTEQKGVAKLAVFAYNRVTGMPVWQSGVFPVTTLAKDTWLAGAGPYQRGTIYDGSRFAGARITLPFSRQRQQEFPVPRVPVTAEAVFDETPRYAVSPGDDVTSAEPRQGEGDAQQDSQQASSGERGDEETSAVTAASATEPLLLEPASSEAMPPTPFAAEPPPGHVLRLPATDKRLLEEQKAAAEQAAEEKRAAKEGVQLLRPSTWLNWWN